MDLDQADSSAEAFMLSGTLIEGDEVFATWLMLRRGLVLTRIKSGPYVNQKPFTQFDGSEKTSHEARLRLSPGEELSHAQIQ